MTVIPEEACGSRGLHDAEPPTAERVQADAEPSTAERVLADAERRDELELVIAAARLGFCRLDLASGGTRANSLFKAEFGWPPDADLTWEDFQARLSADSRARLADVLGSAPGAGEDFDLLVEAAWSSATSQWIAIRGRQIRDEDGTPRTLLLTSRNVTDENRTARRDADARAAAVEHERKLRADAEAANRGKDAFLSLFSHELRSPLNAILGWNRILAMKRAEDAEVTSVTARIEHSARVQLKMVNDLLDVRRIETGKLRIEPRPMQLAKVAAAAVELARPLAAAKGITLTQTIEPGAGALRGDPDRLQQVVSNLLSNALKFTASGGRITLDLYDRDEVTELRVQDTGHGITAELLPHVFDRFRQGDNSSTRHTGGLGLGLALVREIVHLHGGCVSVESRGSGTGATFTVRLPTRRAWKSADSNLTADPDEASGATRSLAGLSILVVDDEADARTIVAEALRLEGANVTITECAAAAFQKLQEPGSHFDILVSDIGMPQEDGYSLIRRLRALQGGGRLLAVAVTGYASRTDVDAAMDAGFNLHVPKPVDFDTFVPLMRRLVARET